MLGGQRAFYSIFCTKRALWGGKNMVVKLALDVQAALTLCYGQDKQLGV